LRASSGDVIFCGAVGFMDVCAYAGAPSRHSIIAKAIARGMIDSPQAG
jgi:hypothetical protein